MGCAATKVAVEPAGPPAPAAAPGQPQPAQAQGAEAKKVNTQIAKDEARIAREAAEPLPEGSTWHDYGGKELEPLLAYTTVIDAAWLLKFAKGEVMPERNGVVPPWQQVPPEATVGLAQLRRTTMALQLPIGVMSYGWAARDHPDPTGEQLRRLVPALEAMVHSCTHGKAPYCPNERPAVWGIVWDCAPSTLDPCAQTSGPCRTRLDHRHSCPLARDRLPCSRSRRHVLPARRPHAV